ncbi:hypothetical protein MPER_08086, partial [Moniliophthora perniciosa FA553]
GFPDFQDPITITTFAGEAEWSIFELALPLHCRISIGQIMRKVVLTSRPYDAVKSTFCVKGIETRNPLELLELG